MKVPYFSFELSELLSKGFDHVLLFLSLLFLCRYPPSLTSKQEKPRSRRLASSLAVVNRPQSFSGTRWGKLQPFKRSPSILKPLWNSLEQTEFLPLDSSDLQSYTIRYSTSYFFPGVVDSDWAGASASFLILSHLELSLSSLGALAPPGQPDKDKVKKATTMMDKTMWTIFFILLSSFRIL